MKIRYMVPAILICLSVVSKAQNTIAFVISGTDDQTPVLTASETALRDTIEQLELGTINYLSSHKSITYDFGSTDLVVSCLNNFPMGWADTLLNRGINVMLLNSALYCLNATWQTSSSSTYRSIKIQSSEAFLDGYAAGPVYQLSNSGNTMYATVDLFAGWARMGVVYGAGTSTPVYYYLNGSARGSALGYDPVNLSAFGWDIVKRMVRWGVGQSPEIPAVSPSRSVTMLIYDLDDSSPVLNGEEKTLSDSLKLMGYSLFYVSSSRAGMSDFSASRFVVSCSNAFSYGSADSLVNSGSNVLFLGKGMGAVGNYGTTTNETKIDTSTAFFTGYPQGALYRFADTTFYGPRKTNTTWSIIGAGQITTYTSMALKKETGGARGAALGYRFSGLSDMGWDVVKKAIHWVEEGTVTTGDAVSANSVVFITRYFDTDSLLPEEQNVVSLLREQGVNDITFVSSTRVGETDLSPARLVVSAAVGIGVNRHDTLLAGGTNVLLFGAALTTFPDTWNRHSLSDQQAVAFLDEQFLKGYTRLTYNTGIGEAYNMSVFYTWKGIGKLNDDSWPLFIGYKIVDQARGALYGICPAVPSQFSWDIMRRMVKYALELECAPPDTIPSQKIAFVKLGLDSLPVDLDTSETILRDSLISMGYEDIVYVPSSRVRVTEFKNAKAVVLCKESMHYPFFDSLIVNGINMVALGEALTMEVFDEDPVYMPLVIDSSMQFFTGMGKGVTYSTGSLVYSLRLNEPYHCTRIGGNGNYSFAFSYEDSNRVAVAGLEPSSEMNAYGWEIVRRMMAWCTGETFVAPASVKPSSVSMVIHSLDDQTPVLDSTESEMTELLDTLGYDSITYVSSFRAEITDFSPASLVTATKSAIGVQKFDTLLNTGVGVVLMGEGIFSIGGKWLKSTATGTVRMTDPSAFLEGYPRSGVYSLTNRQAFYDTSDIPSWNYLACDSAKTTYRRIFRSSGNATRGAAMGCNIEDLNSFGTDVAVRMIRWAAGDTFVKPVEIPHGNIAFVVYRDERHDSGFYKCREGSK